MHFVYVLESESGRHFYVGLTEDVERRLAKHNSGSVPHTAKFRPWVLRTFIAFNERQRAAEFEKYLKSGSGRAFARKRL
ncbi:MAG: excinuclease ABC subunit C [Rhodobacterales bacterium CG15_BIG_FIL_POST_REV_8_21_14_020_59_13]|nr:MAG: excinuclease ABC subunit C [Rhodobacterales bacterium CG15_BIG_FIL_POST_REV_8_21_14_020_59_13]